MRCAIHIVRKAGPGRSTELLATYQARGTLDGICREARDLLWAHPAVDQNDYVLVRRVLDGKEIYRWHLHEADRGAA